MQKSSAANTSQKFFGDLMQVTNINKKFTGTGGMTSSLAVKKPKQLPQLKKTGIFDPLPPEKSTVFKLHYDRGDLPISVSFNGATRKIKWWIELEKLGYKFYFPIFLEGLRETQEPYKFLAEQGCYGMIIRGKGKIKEVLPDIIFPIKKALQTKDPEIMCKTLRILQKLVLEHIEIGEDLVPYYRQLLPTLNLFVNKNSRRWTDAENMGDKMDYSQQKNMNLSELIMETLEILERYGGEDAYITIKYMIPTYESCVY